MKQATNDQQDTEMRPEYDFSEGVRGKYVRRYREGTNVVLLEPDLGRADHGEPPRS